MKIVDFNFIYSIRMAICNFFFFMYNMMLILAGTEEEIVMRRIEMDICDYLYN